ncbi:MAG: flagellin [Peptococcaceae bacterium]|nr:flagellin [Peptococcaceae bacterium]
MGMVVRTNTMAINANRQLGVNNSSVAKSLEKLASGFRINRAADDASGLAISEKMKAQIKGLEQASANSQDGISLIQTAEGATTEIHNMLNRMTELATKSANGTIQDEVDREAIQQEVNDLKSEITRISKSTNFNGINLLDGSLAGGAGATGSGLTGGVVATFKAAKTTNIDAASTASADLAEAEKMVIDGVEINVDWSSLSVDDQAALKVDWTSTPTAAATKKAASIMETAINNAIDAANKLKNTNVNHVTVKMGTAAGDFSITSGLEGSKVSSITYGGNTASLLGVMGATSGTAVTAVATDKLSADPADINSVAFDLVLDGETVNMSVSGIVNTDDGGSDNADAIKTGIDTALAAYGAAKGLTSDEITALKASITVKFNENGQFEITNNSGKTLSFADKNGGKAAQLLGLSTEGKSVANGGLTLQVGDTNDDFNKVTVAVDDLTATGLGLTSLNVSDQNAAGNAIQTIKDAINKVSTNRANLGSLQNRLEYTINNLDTTAENMTAANSRIRDTDMAKEMMNYTKTNILTQAAQAMLAQANQQPQAILQLLQ